ncbi:phage antirepressor KilAC domain-containing protein, partial [Fructilactobacillus florum]|uniref:phage antirepressor KilAC domain-containing protein n=1 Tax=Fructilactobacillus florum TaxID=640331 RepID=UPI000AEF3670
MNNLQQFNFEGSNALDHNMPKQKYVEQKLFIIKEHVVGTSVFKTPMVTGKGQRYFIDKFCGALAEV